MATLVGSGGRPPPLASHTSNPAKFASVITVSPKIFSPLNSGMASRSNDCNIDSTLIEESQSGTTFGLTSSTAESSVEETSNAGCSEEVDEETLRNLQADYERRREERKQEQDLAASERQRLEEILRICGEYDLLKEAGDRVNQLEKENIESRLTDEKRDSRSSWGSSTKIKTNGSLTSLLTHNRRSGDLAFPFQDGYVITKEATNHESKSDANSRSQPVTTGSERIRGDMPSLKPGLPSELLGLKLGDSSKLGNRCYFPATSPSKCSDLCNQSKISSMESSNEIGNNEDLSACLLQEEYRPIVSNDLSKLLSSNCPSSVASGNWNKHRETGNVASPNTRMIPYRHSDENLQIQPYDFGSRQSSKQRGYQKSAEDARQRIEVLKLRIIDVKNVEEKTVSETQAEFEQLQWEYNALMEQLRREKDRIAVIHKQQMELLLEAAAEREEAERQIESERRRLEEMEVSLEETKKRCQSLGIDPKDDVILKDSALGESIATKTEEVELQKRLFEDLEFQLLEMETRREEEREPQQRLLAAELDQLKQSCGLVEENLRQLTEQKSSLILQVKSDVIDLEKERLLLIEDFRKEKRKLLLLLNQGVDNLSQPTSPVSSYDINFRQVLLSGKSQADKNNELNAIHDVFDPDEELLPKTPSSSTCIFLKLQELQKRIGNVEESGVDSFEDGEEERLTIDRSPVSSTLSIDRLKFWVEDHEGLAENFSRPEFFSGSDEEASVFSKDSQDLFQEYSYEAEGNQSKSPDSDNGYSVDCHYVKKAQLSNEASVASRWKKGEINPMESKLPNLAAETAVVMRQSNRNQSRPMTRYLPVRGSCDLDLRHFIESSGHRLDGNTHVQVTSSSCRGFLVKFGRRFRLWHRRWFLFDRSRRRILYYAEQSERKVRGCVPFDAIEDVFVDHLRTVRSPSPKLTFCLKTTVKNFFLVAPSAEAMRIWIDVLFTGAEGYQEFS